MFVEKFVLFRDAWRDNLHEALLDVFDVDEVGDELGLFDEAKEGEDCQFLVLQGDLALVQEDPVVLFH